MTSQIDPTVPVAGNPTTASERANWATAKGEISALQTQTNGAPFLPLAGATMTGPMLLYNDPTGPMSPVTLGYFQTHGGGGGGSGGIPEAPADGTPYGRQDAGWHSVLGLPGGTLTGGLHFGSALASSVTDLTRHIDLYGGTYGFNVGPGSNLNYNAPSGFTHSLLIAGTAALQIGAAAITASAPITLPADPTLATQAATKRYIDNAITTQAIPDAPNDGHGYVRRNDAWGYGVPQLGASNDVTVVEHTTGTNRMGMITGCLTPYNASSDGVSLQARRLSAPDGSGRNTDGPQITLAGATYPTPNIITLNTGNNAAGFFSWTFDAGGTLTTPGNVTLNQTAATSVYLNVAGPAGFSRNIAFNTAATSRWIVSANSTAETGGNAGSDFTINRMSDAGGVLDTPILISRGNGRINLGNGAAVGSSDPVLVNMPSGKTSRILYQTAGQHMWSCGPNSTGNFSIADETSAAELFRITQGAGQQPTYAYGSRFISQGTSGSNPSVTCYDTGLGGAGIFLGSGAGLYFGTMNSVGAFSVVRGSIDTAGNMSITGTLSQGSDARDKENIEVSDDGLAIVRRLTPKRFNRIASPERRELGFIAQDVGDVLPEAITVRVSAGDGDDDDKLALDTTPLLAVVVNAINELEARLATLETRSLH